MAPEPSDAQAFLAPFPLDELERTSSVIFAVDTEYRLRFMNPAWFRFAADNQGEPEISQQWRHGRSVMDAVPPPLQAFYQRLFDKALQTRPYPRQPLQHLYDCSTPYFLRLHRMSLYPLDDRAGLLVVNSTVIEQPYDPDKRPAFEPDDRYLDQHGMVQQCAHCRRVRDVRELERWDWIPQWAARPPPGTSHTLCDFCFRYYYRSLPGRLLVQRG